MEGKYLIHSAASHLSPVEVAIYKDLSEVERAFSGLKDVIEMRPIYHRTASRVEEQSFIASLAFLLDRALEKKLKSAGLDPLLPRSLADAENRAGGGHRSRQRGA